MESSFTIICNKCGRESTLLENIEDCACSKQTEDDYIDVYGTTNETAKIRCICGNVIERY